MPPCKNKQTNKKTQSICLASYVDKQLIWIATRSLGRIWKLFLALQQGTGFISAIHAPVLQHQKGLRVENARCGILNIFRCY